MELFNRKDTFDFIKAQNLYIKNEIEKLTNDNICNSNLEDLEEYFYNKFEFDLIEVETDINYIPYDVQETKIPKDNKWFDNSYCQTQYYNIDGYKIIYKIPFEGNVDLLYLHPASSILSKFEVDNIINPTYEEEGKIIFSQTYERSFIDSQEHMIEFITKEFNSKFSNYIKMINNVNSDIKDYNSSLMSIIQNHLQERLKKAENYLKLREKLNIPLELNKDAPNIKPIRLKKVKKNKNTSFPRRKSNPVEYGISDADYNNIKNIINLSCISMEKAAKTFSQLEEEELRDVILASLNTHYLGTATGETFNKRGKTDIHIPFDNKSAYIGECKIWTGKSLFIDAINQLFSYMRWRDTKTSLIIFNKRNKNFSKILCTIDDILEKHNQCVKRMRINNNEWQCDFKKNNESDEIVYVNIVIYDLSIEL
ncbi:TPA: hypothetical protein ACOTGN_000688 [Clostridium perfringens]|uniref:hypothetical protein n=1 Tax=Clostridium perfringens TaxID=1502 RepID=UPI0029134563|nr:hypothetical protein [Clostridium perfringens]MDM0799420.1 hypothetical protein [Clostridium perfringens]MDM0826353.1 hypothetical protein [Clostridium perfringens]MDM0866527.1 hypothetical protein [Clostridium perfringens]MDU6894469.1 hypothetical protein [Clostridium perfringens]